MKHETFQNLRVRRSTVGTLVRLPKVGLQLKFVAYILAIVYQELDNTSKRADSLGGSTIRGRFAFDFKNNIVCKIVCRVRGFYNDIELKFKTTSRDGQLVWISDEPNVEFLSVRIRDGFVQLGYNTGGGDVWMTWNRYRVDDMVWHLVNIRRFV